MRQKETKWSPEATIETPQQPTAKEELSAEQITEMISSESETAIREEDQALNSGFFGLGFSAEEGDAIKKETGLGAEINANTTKIRELADEATKQFTKEYSKPWRNAEAQKIRRIRRDISEKKEWIAEVRREKRAVIENEIALLEIQLTEQATTLREIEEEINKRTSKVWFKVKRVFGLAENLPEEQQHNENLEIFHQMNKEVEEKKRLLAETQDLVLHESELKIAKNEVRKFYKEQKSIKDIFEQEKERDVEKVANEKQVLFLHGLPAQNQNGNTESNNPNIGTESMSFIDRAKVVIGLEPTISVSTKHTSSEGVTREKAVLWGKTPVFMKAGLILNGGRILSAYAQDAQTVAENTKIRFSQDDPNLRSAVQENFSKNLHDSIEHKIETGKEDVRQRGWNELTVEGPSVCGSFAYISKIMPYDDFLNGYKQISEEDRRLKYEKYSKEKKDEQLLHIKNALELSVELGIPAYAIKENGEIINLLSKNADVVSQEDVTRNKFSFSVDERIDYIKNALGFSQNEKMTNEMEEKLQEISQMETKNKEEESARENNKTKAEQILHLFDGADNDDFKRYTQNIL